MEEVLLVKETAETISRISKENGVEAIVVIGEIQIPTDENNRMVKVIGLYNNADFQEKNEAEQINNQLSVERKNITSYIEHLSNDKGFEHWKEVPELNNIYCGYIVYDPSECVKMLRKMIEKASIGGSRDLLDKHFGIWSNGVFYSKVYNELTNMLLVGNKETQHSEHGPQKVFRMP